MIAKLMLVSAAAGGLFLAQPQDASAGTSIDVNVGTSPYYYPVQYDSPGSSYHYDPDYDEDEEDRITCSEGRQIVRRAGFRRVRTSSCYGDIYRYMAVRRGFLWRISVESDTGDIVRTRKIRPITYQQTDY